jgi:hypothetical protein
MTLRHQRQLLVRLIHQIKQGEQTRGAKRAVCPEIGEIGGAFHRRRTAEDFAAEPPREGDGIKIHHIALRFRDCVSVACDRDTAHALKERQAHKL